MKKTKRKISLIAWVVALLVVFAYRNTPEHRVERFVAQNSAVLEQTLGEGMNAYPEGLGIRYYNRWNGEHEMSEYLLFTQGDSYYGCYYSPDDVPLPFQNAQSVELVPDGENCWRWQGEGDNRGMTKKITEKWYYFEAGF